MFYFNVVLASGKKPEDVERSLLAEIQKMQDAPVSAAELDKAKNQLVTNELRERETSNGKALALGSAAVLLGDPNRVNTDLARLQAVTAADVQRVMKKYFTANNRLVIYYLPEAAKPPATGSAQRQSEARQNAEDREDEDNQTSDLALACGLLTLALLSRNCSRSQRSAQTPQATPPPPAQPRSVQFPTPVEKTLANGLRVIVIERARHAAGYCSSVVLKNGAEVDPPELAGLGNMLADLMTKGTEKRSATADR